MMLCIEKLKSKWMMAGGGDGGMHDARCKMSDVVFVER
jgi:hypothetical protein